MTIDGRVLVVSSRAVSAFDAEGLSPLWQVPIMGQIRPASTVLDWDAIYFSDNGIELRKLRLADGATVWQSDRVAERGMDDLVVRLADDSLIATTVSSVVPIDTHTGLTSWRGTVPSRPRFEHRLLSGDYLIAVDVAGRDRPADRNRDRPAPDDPPEARPDTDESFMAYFYKHADRSGMIPAGGGLNLGNAETIRSILAVDGALLVLTERDLIRFQP